MRLGFNGLSAQVQTTLEADPFICVGQDYVAAALHRLLCRGRGPLSRYIIQMASSNRSTASLGWNRAAWLPVTSALSSPRRIISTSAAA